MSWGITRSRPYFTSLFQLSSPLFDKTNRPTNQPTEKNANLPVSLEFLASWECLGQSITTQLRTHESERTYLAWRICCIFPGREYVCSRIREHPSKVWGAGCMGDKVFTRERSERRRRRGWRRPISTFPQGIHRSTSYVLGSVANPRFHL